MSELQKRIKRIEETLREVLNVPMNERIQIVSIPYDDRGEAFERAKREKLEELQSKYGKKVDESKIIWIGVVSFRTAGTGTDPL